MPKIYANGVIREMTAEEISEMERMNSEVQSPERTPEERISTLEEENAYLKEALNMLLTGVTVDG